MHLVGAGKMGHKTDVHHTGRAPQPRQDLIRISRIIIDTGLPADIGVRVTDLKKFFPYNQELAEQELFPLEALARLNQYSEEDPQ